MIDVTKLTKEEREFSTGIVNRLGSGDVKSVGTELLAEVVKGLTTEVFQKGYRLETFSAKENMPRLSTRSTREK